MKPSDYLKRGWCQGELRDGDRVCLLGAWRYGRYPRGFISLVHDLVGDAVVWNDAPGRTQAEVVALAERVESELGIN